jgi:glutathione-regulated potassium-efflux system protein KefB
VNIEQLIFATTAMIVATAIAIGVAKKLNLGSIVALLLVGMALGPHSPRPLLVGHVEELQAVGEIGVMLLLLVVGLEIQPSRLWSMRRLVVVLGSLQYLLSAAAIAALVALLARSHWQSAVVVGLGLAMSSDAIALPILEERRESGTPEGQATIAVTIFQTFMVIPVLALIPLLGARTAGPSAISGPEKTLTVFAAVGGVYLFGRYLLPRALALTARNLGSGAFALIVLAAVLAAGLVMSKAGISMALGAFMIGVLLSTTVFAEQVKAAATPAKQILLGLFFIAIGMDIDLRQVAVLGSKLLLYMPLLLAIKFAFVFGLALAFGLNARRATITGLLLTPFDEIAYVIFASARANGLLTAQSHAIGLTMISFSFAVSPILINLGYKLGDGVRATEAPEQEPALVAVSAPVIVVGYGPVGRAICVILERAKIAYVVFEVDLERVHEASKWKHNVQYGDITDPTMMEAVAIARARAVVVSFGRSVLDSLGIPAGEAGAIIGSLHANDYAVLRGIGGIETAAIDASAAAPGTWR